MRTGLSSWPVLAGEVVSSTTGLLEVCSVISDIRMVGQDVYSIQIKIPCVNDLTHILQSMDRMSNASPSEVQEE